MFHQKRTHFKAFAAAEGLEEVTVAVQEAVVDFVDVVHLAVEDVAAAVVAECEVAKKYSSSLIDMKVIFQKLSLNFSC